MVVVAHVAGTPEFYWAILAELSIVLWTVLLFVAPRWSRPRGHRRRFRVVGLGAALLASLITLIGKLVEVWPGNPLFPSGHTAYAVTIATLLVALDVRWLRVVVPLLVLSAIALVLSHYHIAFDIAGGAAVGLMVALALRPSTRVDHVPAAG